MTEKSSLGRPESPSSSSSSSEVKKGQAETSEARTERNTRFFSLEKPSEAVEANAKEIHPNLDLLPDLASTIPNEKFVGFLAKYAGTADEAREYVTQQITRQIELESRYTKRVDPSSGTGKESTVTKDVGKGKQDMHITSQQETRMEDILQEKTKYYFRDWAAKIDIKNVNKGENVGSALERFGRFQSEDTHGVLSARKEFEKAYFRLIGSQRFLYSNEKSFAEKPETKVAWEATQEKINAARKSAWKAMGDVHDFNNLDGGSIDGTALSSSEQFKERDGINNTMKKSLDEIGNTDKTYIMQTIAAIYIPDLERKQSKYKELKDQYGDHRDVIASQELMKQAKKSQNKVILADALKWVDRWIKNKEGKTLNDKIKELGTSRDAVREELETIQRK